MHIIMEKIEINSVHYTTSFYNRYKLIDDKQI